MADTCALAADQGSLSVIGTLARRVPALWPGPVLRQIRACQPVFSAALAGYVEATRDDDARKNQICPANRYPDAAVDWIPLTCTAQRAEIMWATDPDLSTWMQRSRLNATRSMADHQEDPQMKAALGRLFTNIEPAINKLEMLRAGIPGGGKPASPRLNCPL
jgi:hypothetical protein